MVGGGGDGRFMTQVTIHRQSGDGGDGGGGDGRFMTQVTIHRQSGDGGGWGVGRFKGWGKGVS